MNPRQFLQSFPALLASGCLLLTLARGTNAAEVSVAAVLTMAKDEAEKATSEAERAHLRAYVAHIIRRTRQEALFADYVTPALAGVRVQQDTYLGADETLRFDTELGAKAKQAFLDGDERGALELINQCIPRLIGSPCGPSDTFFYSQETFVQQLFLQWEVEAERFDAALRRLKSIGWPPDFFQYMVILSGPTIAGGDQQRYLEIQGLIRRSGVAIEACIVDEASILIPESVRSRVPKPRPLSDTATLRKLACDGRAEVALETARSFETARKRINAFAVIAEGLAGIPGLPNE